MDSINKRESKLRDHTRLDGGAIVASPGSLSTAWCSNIYRDRQTDTQRQVMMHVQYSHGNWQLGKKMAVKKRVCTID